MCALTTPQGEGSWNVKSVGRMLIVGREEFHWPNFLGEVLKMRNACWDSPHRTNKASPVTCGFPFTIQSKAAISWLFFGRFLLVWQKA